MINVLQNWLIKYNLRHVITIHRKVGRVNCLDGSPSTISDHALIKSETEVKLIDFRLIFNVIIRLSLVNAFLAWKMKIYVILKTLINVKETYEIIVYGRYTVFGYIVVISTYINIKVQWLQQFNTTEWSCIHCKLS